VSRKRKNQIDPKLLRHWNLLDRFQKQLAKSIKKSTVSATELDPRRTLTSFNYFSLFLFGLFNPVITSMRGLCAASELERTRQTLATAPVSPASFSEAQHLFEPKLLRGLINEMCGQYKGAPTSEHFGKLPNLCAIDGTLLKALPRMAWALYQSDESTAVKLHMKFNLYNTAPEDMSLSVGKACERKAATKMVYPGDLVVADRYYGLDYGWLRELRDAEVDFVIRIRNNPKTGSDPEVLPLKEADHQAGVISDQRIKLGDHWEGEPVRVVSVKVEDKVFKIATNRLDLPAEMIALIYRHRWQVEMFFKWFKTLVGSRHWFAESPEGAQIQVYLSLIAAMLLMLALGRAPRKREMEMIHFYLSGWASLEELCSKLKIQQ
jgi:hypothetical protein